MQGAGAELQNRVAKASSGEDEPMTGSLYQVVLPYACCGIIVGKSWVYWKGGWMVHESRRAGIGHAVKARAA